MKKNKWLSLVFIVMLALPLALIIVQASEGAGKSPAVFSAEGDWYIVELEGPSLAVYAKSRAGDVSTMLVDGKLNVTATTSQSYIDRLEAQQATFKTAVSEAIPNIHIERDFQIALNAVAVRLPNSEPETLKKLRQMPGVVEVSPQRIYSATMDASLPLIKADALWSQLGGRDSAGAGIKVAVVDSGIDIDHALFDGTGWSYPITGTWPKGEAGYTNGKIIAARFYTPTFEVNSDESLTPQDHYGHGTHVSGSAVGNQATASYAYGAITTTISGVAPGSWLMVYKALFKNVDASNVNGSNIMLIGAVEDAIADGADVISNSWGGSDYEYDDPLTKAYEAAADAGIVVVFAAGNSGPGYNSLSGPNSTKFIQVGASTTSRNYYNALSVTAPTPISPTLQSFFGKEFINLHASAIPTETMGPLPYIPCNLEGHPDTTLPGVTAGITQTEPYVSGWIALIPRGAYSFWVKQDGAIEQGASAAVIYTDNRDWRGSWLGFDRPIYTLMIPRAVGLDAVSWWETYTDTARLQIGYPPTAMTVNDTEDVIADFSSRGPNLRLDIMPDVVAPGVRILSGVADGTYETWQGTSMATPQVAGAAALLKQMHPTWTREQIKSALMSTASQTILDIDEATVADVMTQGAGRIDLSKSGDPGLTFDEPSHSFRMVAAGSVVSTPINATSVFTAAESYALSVQEMVTDTGNVTVTVSPASLNVAAGGGASFVVTLEVGAGAMAQDIQGNVILSGTNHHGHIPYWARIYTPGPDILLIDDDLSGTGGFADYRSYYTSTLDTLGLTYDVWDTTANGNNGPGFPTRYVLDRYDTAVYFSGDGATAFWWWWNPSWQDDLRTYLASGGNMIVFGQDAAWGMWWWHGVNTSGLFGAIYDADNAYGSTPIPQPSAVGLAPFLEGELLDFSGGTGDGAGNMSTVDSLRLPTWTGSNYFPLFEVPNTIPDIQGAGYLGTALTSDPTFEYLDDRNEWWKILYRTAFCSFGLEAVNDDTGYMSRAELLGELFNFINDELSVDFDANAYAVDHPFTPVDFAATMNSSVMGSAASYRWDFGDGSVYETTTADNVSHQYLIPGVYSARVEVTDEYGHTAVSDPVCVTVGSVVYLPVVLNNAP